MPRYRDFRSSFLLTVYPDVSSQNDLCQKSVDFMKLIAEPEMGMRKGLLRCVQSDRPPNAYFRQLPELEFQAPGSVLNCLVLNKVIADPMHGPAEHGAQWIADVAWEVSFPFPIPVANDPWLILEGIDGPCEVRVNGHSLGQVESVFVPFEAPLTDLLESSENVLTLIFEALGPHARRLRDEYFKLSGLDPTLELFDERSFLLGSPYAWGWDWGPCLPCPQLRIAPRITDGKPNRPHVRTTMTPGGFEIKVAWQSGTPALTLRSPIGHDLGNPDRIDQKEAIWTIQEPELWWPNGEGPQPLYSLELKWPNQTWFRKVGLRTIELNQANGAFQFIVNGRSIFARGANWIPHTIATSDQNSVVLRDSLSKWQTLGANMIRIWGGGVVEDDAFYDACDHLGLLIWQDFPYACQYVPDSEEWLQKHSRSCDAIIHRLEGRACIALWCGNNEIHLMSLQGWGTVRPERFHGQTLFDELIPALLAEQAVATPYIPTSPAVTVEGCNLSSHGDQHFWDVWHGKGDWSSLSGEKTRFASEFGFASMASRGCWTEATWPPERNLELQTHNKTGKPWEAILELAERHYPPAHNLDDWIYFSQLAQRDALRAMIEQFRLDPDCAGTLIWQANDCWPTFSWAVEDFARNLKLAGHELQRLFRPLLVGEKDGGIWLATDAPFCSRVILEETQYDPKSGHILKQERNEIDLEPRSLMGPWPIPAQVLSCWTIHGEKPRWFFPTRPKNLLLEPVVLRAMALGHDRYQIEAHSGVALEVVIGEPSKRPAQYPEVAPGEAFSLAKGQPIVYRGPDPSKCPIRSLNKEIQWDH